MLHELDIKVELPSPQGSSVKIGPGIDIFPLLSLPVHIATFALSSAVALQERWDTCPVYLGTASRTALNQGYP